MEHGKWQMAGPFAILVLPFLILATLNSAGYRYGASDQAFYIPAILERLDPALYPRDTALIESQARLTAVDEAVALAARVAAPSTSSGQGGALPVLCAMLYVVSLALLAWAALRIASILYRSPAAAPWAGVALVFALSLRHAIARSGTNTLEGYFHPRQLAFGFGAIAIASFLRGRYLPMAVALTGAAVIHPTTALWFTIWLGVATLVAERRWRPVLVPAAAAGAIAAAWMLTLGPLAGRLIVMDPAWLDTLSEKQYLFPLQWPAWVWVMNLGYIPIILFGFAARRRAGVTVAREPAVVAGCLSLVGVFAVALVLHTWPIALSVQLQPSRIFWMLDFLATIYVVWLLAEGTAPSRRRAAVAAAMIAGVSLLRGSYIAIVRFPERRVAQLGIRDDDWGRVMAWARASDVRRGWIADPGHAAIYGTSVRVAGWRDVLVEEIKDEAIGMYDRGIAMRTRERLEALGPFAALTPDHARAVGAKYDLDYLVIDRELPLPEAFRAGSLRVYSLR